MPRFCSHCGESCVDFRQHADKRWCVFCVWQLYQDALAQLSQTQDDLISRLREVSDLHSKRYELEQEVAKLAREIGRVKAT